MKRTIVAILALSPVLAFAQTNSPAQPRSTQIAEVHAPASLPATSADRAAAVSKIRVSTGVTPPRVIHAVNFVATQSRSIAVEQKVVVDLNVDETGKPTDLTVEKSAGALLDKAVLATLSQYRFAPGTLDGIPAAVPVKLEVIIPAGTIY